MTGLTSVLPSVERGYDRQVTSEGTARTEADKPHGAHEAPAPGRSPHRWCRYAGPCTPARTRGAWVETQAAGASPRSPGAAPPPQCGMDAGQETGKRASRPHGQPAAAVMGREGVPCHPQGSQETCGPPGCQRVTSARRDSRRAPPRALHAARSSGVHTPSPSECPGEAQQGAGGALPAWL